MPWPLPDPALPRSQRKNMARPPQILHFGARMGEHPARLGPIARRNPRGHTLVVRIHADSVSRPIWVRVLAHHLRQLQRFRALRREGRANQTARVADHEGHLFGGDVFGGYDEVAFVFAGGGIEDDDKVTEGERGDAGFYGVE